jgi:hypothetical protein
MNGRLGLIGAFLAALLVALILVSCRASHERIVAQSTNGAISALGGSENAESRQIAIERVLDDIAGYQPAPDAKVDSLVFEELRAALAAQIEAKARDSSGAIKYGTPQGDDGRVTDLRYDPETYTLSWTYVNKGDYDQSGEVGVSDITPIAQNYLEKTADGIGNDAY